VLAQKKDSGNVKIFVTSMLTYYAMVNLNSTSDGDVLYVKNNSARADTYVAKFLNNTTTVMSILANGFVGIGTTSSSYRLQVGQTSNYGYVAANGTWANSSDIRFKENIVSLESASCLNKVNSLNGISYNVKGDTQRQIGFSAQDIENIIPEIVTKDANGYLGIAYANITPVLVEAIKELSAQNLQLKSELESLSGKEIVFNTGAVKSSDVSVLTIISLVISAILFIIIACMGMFMVRMAKKMK